MTFISCHKIKRPKLLKYASFIMSLERISSKKMTPISHDEMTHLANNCVAMNEFMDILMS